MPWNRVAACRTFAWTVILAAAVTLPISARQDARPLPPGEAAIPLGRRLLSSEVMILRKEEDLAGLLRRIGQPDFVLTPGPALDPASGQAPTREIRSGGVTSIDVSAEVADGRDVAQATLVFGVVTAPGASRWVSVGLAKLFPRRAIDRESGAELAWEAEADGRWRVRVEGPGRRTIAIEAAVPIERADDRRRLTLDIVEAASTHLRIDLPYAVSEAATAEGAPLVVADRAGAGPGAAPGARIEANLPARSLLEVDWSPRIDSAEARVPLLTARGDLALQLSERAFTAKSSWIVRSERGEARSIGLRLPAEDELVAIELDNQPIGHSIDPKPAGAGGDWNLISIALPSRLRRGETRGLTITTRRRYEDRAPDEFVFRGHPFRDVDEQTGSVTLTGPPTLSLRGEARGGARRIDPRELSDALLRDRASSLTLAFLFNEQPFEIVVRAARAAPRVRVESRSSVALLETSILVSSWFDYLVSDGRVFELRVLVPPGLEPEAVGPPDVVASWELTEPSEVEPDRGGAPASRVLRIALAESIPDPTTFRIELVGRGPRSAVSVAAGPTAPEVVDVPLFQSESGRFQGGRVALWTTAELEARGADESTPIDRSDATGPVIGAEGWPAIADQSPPLQSGASLTIDHARWLAGLPIVVEQRSRRIHRQSLVALTIGRRTYRFAQDLTLYVRAGQLTSVDLIVPPGLEGRWELLDRAEVASSEPLGLDEGIGYRHRLRLVRPLDGSIRLQFRATVPLAAWSASERTTIVIPAIDLDVSGTAEPSRIDVDAEPGIDLTPVGEGWTGTADLQPTETPRNGGAFSRRVWLEPQDSPGRPSEDPSLEIAIRPLSRMPSPLVSRLWILSTRESNGVVQNSAWFRVEVHDGSFAFALPPGSILESGSLAGAAVAEVERQREADSYRIRIPDGLPAGFVVGIEYQAPATTTALSSWAPPRLLGEGRVQQTLWELRVPWSEAVVGRPAGWTDENRWYWGGYVWKRRPWKEVGDLSAWVADLSTRPEQLAPRPDPDRPGDHGYLFGRTGNPGPLAISIAPRAVLVGLCSGGVLGLGLLALSLGPLPKWSGVVLLAAILLCVVLIEPSTLILGAQSSALGFVLLAVAAMTQWVVERRRHIPRRTSEPTGPASVGTPTPASSTPSPSAPAPSPVGSDDSTALRARNPAGIAIGPSMPISAVASTASVIPRPAIAPPAAALDHLILEIPRSGDRAGPNPGSERP